MADLNAGKGTAGQLLKDDQMANQLKGTMGKLDNILDRVNSGQGTIGPVDGESRALRFAQRHHQGNA